MTLSEFQHKITAQGMDAYIVTRNNLFLGQDILPEENKIKQLTGFTGSAGTLIVFADKAVLLVDGRYELQAAREVDTSKVTVVCTHETVATWLQNNIEDKLKIGYNSWCHAINEVDYWARVLKRFTFVEDSQNLLGSTVSSKPYEIFEHDIEFAGVSMDEKVGQLTKFIADNKLDAFLVTACDSVSWLLNLRSDCLPDTPILRAYALVNAAGEVSLFTSDFSKLQPEFAQYAGKTIGLSYNQTPKAIYTMLKSHKIWIENLANPIQNWKAVKNPIEISNTEAAHRRDAAAICRFLIWLEHNWQGKTELDIVDKLFSLRQSGNNFFSNSFETIAGFGANGAVIHYQPTPQTNAELKDGSLLLLDSGAQYFDGTTDITRTIAIGKPQPDMIDNFTTVLKAHISLASAIFPAGTAGQALDILARSQLWQKGKDYNHGTGHGVGFFLNVHEGPQSISSRSSLAPLQPNMIVSIEPGYYQENAYGIRIENLVKITPHIMADSNMTMLKFEPLTLVPLDKSLINKYLLTQSEIEWINNYHQQVLEQIAPLLAAEEQNWLKEACSPL